jgi:hypothetical protein
MQFGRPAGEHVKFLSANTLHLIDQALWLCPFSTSTDLEEAAKNADISLDRRSGFLKTLRDEHSRQEAQAQLWKLWKEWLDKRQSGRVKGAAGGGCTSPRVATPTEEDEAEAAAALEEAEAEAAPAAQIPAKRGAKRVNERHYPDNGVLSIRQYYRILPNTTQYYSLLSFD